MDRSGLLWLLLRCSLIFTTSYIHPDEFFQSPEIAAGASLGVDAVRAWEWQPEWACRAYLPVWLVSALPLRLFATAFGPGGWPALLAPRLVCLALSLLTDFAAVRLSPTAGRVVRSAWPLLLLLRPFSNSLEAACLAAALLLYARLPSLALVSRRRADGKATGDGHTSPALVCAALGAVAVIGLFVRFTFVVFCAPLALALCARFVRAGDWRSPLAAVAGALPALAALLAADRVYFGRWTLTPLNSAAYNSNAANLAAHGLHNRATHALVFAPLLFGPLYLTAVWWLVRRLWAICRPPANASARAQWPMDLCAAIAVGGIGALSLAPHQEPRFLLPLLLPLAVVGGPMLCSSRTLWRLWLLFNALPLLFYGAVHQAGVVPSLLYAAAHCHSADLRSQLSAPLPIDRSAPLHFVYFRTYPPPVSLTGQRAGARCLRVHDAGSDPQRLWPLLAAIDPSQALVLVYPAAAAAALAARPAPFDLHPLTAFAPHFSGEDPPLSLAAASLLAAVVHRHNTTAPTEK